MPREGEGGDPTKPLWEMCCRPLKATINEEKGKGQGR
jgi:hypothetical protein